MTEEIYCAHFKTKLPQLTTPPIPGELGQRIFNEISAQAWQKWLETQTMLINEHRLNLSTPEARDFLRQQMTLFLFEGKEVKPAGFQKEDQ